MANNASKLLASFYKSDDIYNFAAWLLLPCLHTAQYIKPVSCFGVSFKHKHKIQVNAKCKMQNVKYNSWRSHKHKPKADHDHTALFVAGAILWSLKELSSLLSRFEVYLLILYPEAFAAAGEDRVLPLASLSFVSVSVSSNKATLFSAAPRHFSQGSVKSFWRIVGERNTYKMAFPHPCPPSPIACRE